MKSRKITSTFKQKTPGDDTHNQDKTPMKFAWEEPVVETLSEIPQETTVTNRHYFRIRSNNI